MRGCHHGQLSVPWCGDTVSGINPLTEYLGLSYLILTLVSMAKKLKHTHSLACIEDSESDPPSGQMTTASKLMSEKLKPADRKKACFEEHYSISTSTPEDVLSKIYAQG
ncbi:hypothetical protein K439DRAFT_1623178 [Ramaria rubella]|nr:hypothetical protein K439DRAFT_1623178 [Ramaria rubella]